jgi:Fic family protein
MDTLLGWHRELLAGHSPLRPELIGALRLENMWVGGSAPLDAAYVPPPAEQVPVLMDDLLAWLNTRQDTDRGRTRRLHQRTDAMAFDRTRAVDSLVR